MLNYKRYHFSNVLLHKKLAPNLQRKQQGSTPSQNRKQPVSNNSSSSSATKSKQNETSKQQSQLPTINDLKINSSGSNDNIKK